MRIASNHFGINMLSTLRASNSKIADLMAQTSSGNRILRPSDDPIGTVRLALLERDSSMLSQYRGNIGALSIRLQQNEIHLDGMLKDVMEGHDLMLRAADGSNSPSDLNAMAGPLRTLKDNLFQSANARDSAGHYLFAGTRTETPAMVYDPAAPVGSRYRFDGNTAQQQVVIGNGVTQAGNVSVENLAGLLNRIDEAVTVISNPNVDANDPATRAVLVASLDDLDEGIGSISAKISGLGSAQNTLSLLDENHAAMLVSNDEATYIVGQVDFAEAMEALNGYMTSIQGTYKVYERVTQLSLFDLL
ncbi:MULTISPECIES: flagellar hook-associated protein FlgL [unclassified Caballeronia]|uniref:flagellar hook-associated protein FlgL n=1 Tax=unclassified Caballeronia TaxID=2646786 RepID=UPI003ECECE71